MDRGDESPANRGSAAAAGLAGRGSRLARRRNGSAGNGKVDYRLMRNRNVASNKSRASLVVGGTTMFESGALPMGQRDDDPRPAVVDMTNFDTFITGATIPEDCGSYYRYSLYQDRRPDPERPGTVERVIVQRIVITKEDFHRMFLRRMEWMHGRRRDLS